jgi:high-affinity iron transporter
MSLAMLRMDKAKAKWRVKLAAAFHERPVGEDSGKHGGRSSKYALFLLPLITVLREGLEAVIFVGGVALGEPAKSIPIAAIVGLLCVRAHSSALRVPD